MRIVKLFIIYLIVIIYSLEILIFFFIPSEQKNMVDIKNTRIKLAKEKKIKSILLSGFDGGKASKIADININIKSNNYGIIEDCHQSIMHLISQKIAKII